jgi:hypothetical protein
MSDKSLDTVVAVAVIVLIGVITLIASDANTHTLNRARIAALTEQVHQYEALNDDLLKAIDRSNQTLENENIETQKLIRAYQTLKRASRCIQ